VHVQQNYGLKRVNACQPKFGRAIGRLIFLKAMNKLTYNQFLHDNCSLTCEIKEMYCRAYDYKNNLSNIIVK
jgi:hypothetical protein